MTNPNITVIYWCVVDMMLITYFIVGALSLSCEGTVLAKECGVNEEYADCKITCPPQFCNNSYTDYGICPENPKCEPGCNCKKDYLRDSYGTCVFNEDCPPPSIQNLKKIIPWDECY
ncbi:unnamed protein product, partial [Iphiclides podalirius]